MRKSPPAPTPPARRFASAWRSSVAASPPPPRAGRSCSPTAPHLPRWSPAPAGREVILIDDGLATGITLRAAIQALNHAGACRIVVAVPTGHEESLAELAERGGMATVYCANMRGGRQFCVASAYRHWCDVTSEEASDLLRAARSAAVPARRGGG